MTKSAYGWKPNMLAWKTHALPTASWAQMCVSSVDPDHLRIALSVASNPAGCQHLLLRRPRGEGCYPMSNRNSSGLEPTTILTRTSPVGHYPTLTLATSFRITDLIVGRPKETTFGACASLTIFCSRCLFLSLCRIFAIVQGI